MYEAKENVVVYRSELERQFDQWMWQGNHALWFAAIILAIIALIVLVGWIKSR